MKGRIVRILVLLWLGWYLSGPLAETVDFWDTPGDETADVVRSAGGLVALLGAAIVVAAAQSRKVGERLQRVSRQVLSRAACRKELALDSAAPFPSSAMHSPLVTLRI